MANTYIHYYRFGVEIEVIAEPHGPPHPGDYEPQCNFYYEKLAEAMCKHRLNTQAERRYEGHKSRCSPERWTVLYDRSLELPKRPIPPAIALEAVSPIFESRSHWEAEIDKFWTAFQTVFKMPQSSVKTGFHIHVTPSHLGTPGQLHTPREIFSLDECKAIAFGIVFFGECIHKMLPPYRRDNTYCMANTLRSPSLINKGNDEVMKSLMNVRTKKELVTLMQGDNPKEQRYVLWNFVNIASAPKGKAPTGTVEFRGGRGLRGRERTKRWIAFTVGFIDLCCNQFLKNDILTIPPYYVRPDTGQTYEMIRSHASKYQMHQWLPDKWLVLNESHTTNGALASPTRNDRIVPKDEQDPGSSQQSPWYSLPTSFANVQHGANQPRSPQSPQFTSFTNLQLSANEPSSQQSSWYSMSSLSTSFSNFRLSGDQPQPSGGYRPQPSSNPARKFRDNRPPGGRY